MKTNNKKISLNPKQWGVLLGTFSLLIFFQNCSEVSFGPAEASLGSACDSALEDLSSEVKFLFVLDQSGSNDGLQGTDPDKAVRAGSIQQFFEIHKSKPNFYWGMIGFSSGDTTPLIQKSSRPVFTTDPAVMQKAIDRFLSLQDEGNTPYETALKTATEMIAQDSSTDSSTRYVVVFLSDGMPDPSLSDSKLLSLVLNLVSAKAGQVSFNSVFYGEGQDKAPVRLKAMADAGDGRFLDTNTNPAGKSFEISNLVTVPGVCGG